VRSNLDAKVFSNFFDSEGKNALWPLRLYLRDFNP
jgi:hypothetical protein